MNIPNDFNPMGINSNDVNLTKGLDFYAPFEQNFNDIANNLTASGAGYYPLCHIQSIDDVYSSIGSSLFFRLDFGSAVYSLYYQNTGNMFQYGTADFSISFYLRAPNWTNYNNNCIVAKKLNDNDTGFVNFRNNSQTQMNMRVAETNNFSTTTSVLNKKWVHWAFVRKDGIGYWYRNGVLDATGTCDGNASSTDLLRIGYHAQWTTRAVYDLKALRIYNRALNLNEINALKDEFGTITYRIHAENQSLTFYPYPNNQTASIQYTTIADSSSISFQITSGTLPQGITFNTSTGVFTGKSTDTTQDQTVQLNVKIKSTESDIADSNNIVITLQLKKETLLEIPSPQTYTFTTESTQYATVNVNTGGLPTIKSTYILANSVETVGSGSNGSMTIRSWGDQTSASSTTTVVQYYTEYHPTKVYVTYNINVVLNQITASNQSAQFYSEDGVKTYQVKYTSQKTITPVYSLSGTLPSGITFDNSTGTFTYDGTNTTAGTTTVQVTIASSTGCSTPATATITLQIKEGSNPFQGLIFNAPLQDDFSATGGSITNQNGFAISSNYQGKKCAVGTNAYYAQFWNLDNPITGNVPFTFSCEYYKITASDNQGIFYIGKAETLKVFGFEATTANEWGTAWGTGSYDNTPTVIAGAWTIFTATYDKTAIKLYNNGVLVATLSPITLDITKSTGSFSGNYGDLAIGGRFADRRPWKGGIRNFYIFDYAMDSTEVAALYNYTKDL